MNENRIKQAIDERLTCLRMTERDAGRIVSLALDGERVKRKGTLVVVLAAVLVTLIATAVALSIDWKDAGHYLSKERNRGSFVHWTPQEQIDLVLSLAEDGLLDKNEDVARLIAAQGTEEERAMLAHRIMADWLSISSDYVSFRSIMERLWGEFVTWNVERKAWYSQTLIDAGIDMADAERFVLPEESDLSQDSAVQAARAYAGVWLNIPAEEMKRYLAYADFVIFPKPQAIDGQSVYTTDNMKPEWFIHLLPPPDLPDESSVMVSVNPRNGLVDIHQLVGTLQYRQYGYQNWPELAVETERFMQQQQYRPFMEWSLEAKAEWSRTFRDAILSAEDGLLDVAVRAFARYTYGLPGQHAIGREKALATARHGASQKSGLNAKAFERYNLTYSYFDVTDAEKPKWRFQFAASGENADTLLKEQPDGLVFYRVEVDAQSGALLQVEAYVLTEQTGYEGIVKQL